MMKITEVVKQLLIINVIFFAAKFIVPAVDTYMSLYYFENPLFHFWQPISHMFMHANIMHIFFNMFALYSFGSTLEHFWGGQKFLFFYISCGLGAAALHMGVNYFQVHSVTQILIDNGIDKNQFLAFIVQNGNLTELAYNRIDISQYVSFSNYETLKTGYFSYSVGASGAIYGLLVAFAFMFPNAELALMFIPVPVKAKYFVPGILALDLFLGFNGGAIFGNSTGIAHFAHIGGAIMGFIMMMIWKKNQFNKNRWDR